MRKCEYCEAHPTEFHQTRCPLTLLVPGGRNTSYGCYLTPSPPPCLLEITLLQCFFFLFSFLTLLFFISSVSLSFSLLSCGPTPGSFHLWFSSLPVPAAGYNVSPETFLTCNHRATLFLVVKILGSTSSSPPSLPQSLPESLLQSGPAHTLSVYVQIEKERD